MKNESKELYPAEPIWKIFWMPIWTAIQILFLQHPARMVIAILFTLLVLRVVFKALIG